MTAKDTEKHLYEFDGFQVDPVRRRLSRGGEMVPLTPKALSILLALLERRGEVVEKDTLLQEIWPNTFVTEANLTQNVSSLRKALGERAGDHRYVVTVPGRGYSFVAEVREGVPEAEASAVSEAPAVSEVSEGSPGVALSRVEPGLEPVSGAWPVWEPDAESGSWRVPVRGRFLSDAKRRIVLVGLAVWSVVTVLMVLVFLLRQGRPEAPQVGDPVVARRPSIAVLGFRSLSGTRETAWLATAFSEMLATELGAGAAARVIPGDSVARLRQSLSLPYTDNLDTSVMEKLRSLLGADLAVVGSYLSLGEKGGGQIRLDIRVMRVPDGEVLASLAEVGSETELFELISRAGAKLRHDLGWADPSPGELQAVQALRPANPEAARLYSQGLSRLRAYDMRGGRDFLRKAAEADPTSAIIRSALSQAWAGLGHDAESLEEARRAVELSESLPRPDRLAIQARFHEASRDWEKAGEIYRSLWTFFPDDLEHGLLLVNNLTTAGKPAEARETLAALRRLPPPAGLDPRIDLAEALLAKRLSDPLGQIRAAESAEAKGRLSGELSVVAQALAMRGEGYLSTGKVDEALQVFLQARDLFGKVGNKTAEALLLTHLGVAFHEKSDLARAEEMFQEALTIVRSTGSLTGTAAQFANLGLVYQDMGDFTRSQAQLTRSYALFLQSGEQVLATRTLYYLGTVLVARGDLPGARERFERVLVGSRESGNRTDEARALDQLGVLLARQGALREARRHQEQALTVAEGLADPSRRAAVVASLGEVESLLGDPRAGRRRLEEAVAAKRQVRDRIGTAQILGPLAQLSFRSGDLARARRLSEEQLDIARETGAGAAEVWAVADLGRWSLAAGDFPRARQSSEEALRRAIANGMELDASGIRLCLAEVALEEGKPAEAARLAREVVGWSGVKGFLALQTRALAVLAEALLAEGRPAQAEEAAQRLRARLARTEDRDLRIFLITAVARVDAAAGRTAEATGALERAVADAARFGLVSAGFEARLALGEIRWSAAGDANGRAILEALRRDAEAAGFRAVAARAAATLMERHRAA